MKKLLLLPVLFIAFISCNNKKDEKNGATKVQNENTGKETTERSVVGKWKPIHVNMPDKDYIDRDIMMNTTWDITADEGYVDGTSFVYDASQKTVSIKSKNEINRQFTVSWDGDNLVLTDPKGSLTLKRLD